MPNDYFLVLLISGNGNELPRCFRPFLRMEDLMSRLLLSLPLILLSSMILLAEQPRGFDVVDKDGAIVKPEHLSAAERAPDFTLMDLDGKRVKLSDAIKKGPVLIDFWATWCKPCLQELPHVNELYRKHREQGLQVFAITIDSPKSQSKVKPFIKGQGYEFTVLLDQDSEARKLFGGKDVPLTILIDRKGEVVFRHLGYVPGDEKSLEEKVGKLVIK